MPNKLNRKGERCAGCKECLGSKATTGEECVKMRDCPCHWIPPQSPTLQGECSKYHPVGVLCEFCSKPSSEIENGVEGLRDLKCVNGTMYFGSVDSNELCDCSDGCRNHQTFEQAVAELEAFIHQIVAKTRAEEREKIKLALKESRKVFKNWTCKAKSCVDPLCGHGRCVNDMIGIFEENLLK